MLIKGIPIFFAPFSSNCFKLFECECCMLTLYAASLASILYTGSCCLGILSVGKSNANVQWYSFRHCFKHLLDKIGAAVLAAKWITRPNSELCLQRTIYARANGLRRSNRWTEALPVEWSGNWPRLRRTSLHLRGSVIVAWKTTGQAGDADPMTLSPPACSAGCCLVGGSTDHTAHAAWVAQF